MAAGRVCTGFSMPFAAGYAAASGSVTYTGCAQIARGVDVTIAVESSTDNKFYADNVVAETSAGRFNSGTLTLTVDGLKDAAEKLLFGTPTAGSDGAIHFGDSVSIPYVGLGFVARYMSDGVESFVGIVLPKVRFALPQEAAKTQSSEDLEWQTQQLTATIFRDDTSGHDWKIKFTEEDTEAEAVAKVRAFLGVTGG